MTSDELKRAAGILAADRAEVATHMDAVLLPDAELAVRWNDISQAERGICEQALALYCWPTNMAGSGSPATFVTAPVVKGATFPGIWRAAGASAEWSPGTLNNATKAVTYNLTWKLRWGFATSILLVTTDDPPVTSMDMAQARLVQPAGYEDGRAMAQPRMLDIEWRNLNPTNLEDLADSVLSTLSSPTIAGQEYAGTWTLIGKIETSQVPDGSGRLLAHFAVLASAISDFSSAMAKYEINRKTLTITWSGINKSALASCADAVPTTLSSPQIQGATFSGSWVRKGEVQADPDEQGVGRLVAVFSTEPDEVGNASTWASLIPATKNQLEASGRYTKRFGDRAAAVSAAITALTTLPDGKTLTVSIGQGPEGAILDIHASDAVKADTLWLPCQGAEGTNYVRVIENATMTEILAALALTDTLLWRSTSGTTHDIGPTANHNISPRPMVPAHKDRYSIHLHATLPGGGGSKPPADWANFSELEKAGYKHCLINGVAKRIPLKWGIIQSNSHSTVATALVTGGGESHFTPINGGRHFRGFYTRWTGQPGTLASS